MSHWPLPNSPRSRPSTSPGRTWKVSWKAGLADCTRSSRIQHEQRFADRLDDRLGVIARFLQPLLGALDLVDVDQHDHRAVDPVVGRAVGMDAQRRTSGPGGRAPRAPAT